MKKTFNIYNYKGTPTEITINHIEDVALMTINVLTGDEVLNVIYKDGRCEEHEASCSRIMDFYDGTYVIYNFEKDKNLIADKRWLNSTSSYERLELHDQD